jgi:hypothetical protein
MTGGFAEGRARYVATFFNLSVNDNSPLHPALVRRGIGRLLCRLSQKTRCGRSQNRGRLHVHRSV